jgi:hypothetical protein
MYVLLSDQSAVMARQPMLLQRSLWFVMQPAQVGEDLDIQLPGGMHGSTRNCSIFLSTCVVVLYCAAHLAGPAR